jgi:uncharacterized protein YneF (UPF0154 family)
MGGQSRCDGSRQWWRADERRWYICTPSASMSGLVNPNLPFRSISFQVRHEYICFCLDHNNPHQSPTGPGGQYPALYFFLSSKAFRTSILETPSLSTYVAKVVMRSVGASPSARILRSVLGFLVNDLTIYTTPTTTR